VKPATAVGAAGEPPPCNRRATISITTFILIAMSLMAAWPWCYWRAQAFRTNESKLAAFVRRICLKTPAV
jgi:hypothetical protein